MIIAAVAYTEWYRVVSNHSLFDEFWPENVCGGSWAMFEINRDGSGSDSLFLRWKEP